MTKEFAKKLKNIEEKWQGRWEEERLYEVDANEEDKFFITVAYPYPSGGMHIGHVRTYALPDVFARYKRMQGNNVLFPMAWHVTGTPIIGALDRLKEGEEEQLRVLRDVYGVSEDILDGFEEPMDFAEYFIEESYKKNIKELGFSVDWRREFTTADDKYNKFIEWQYRKLKEKDLLKKGLHPTKYDVKSQNPVTTHDLLEGETADIQDYTLVKFSSDEVVFPCATLRPETVYGATHIMVHPDETYVKIRVDDEIWVVTEEAREKLEHQDRETEIIEEINGRSFVGSDVVNPVTEETVKILPGTFIDSNAGTGVVMSVPAHAPYDWITLQNLKQDEKLLQKYDIKPEEIQKIMPKPILTVPDQGGIPAKEKCEAYDISSAEDVEKLEKATNDLYEEEFHNGKLNKLCGEYSGKAVKEAKEKLREAYEEKDIFSSLYDFSEPVRSRSGGKVIVSLEETWFINYKNEEWKKRARSHLEKMDIIPEEKKDQIYHAIDWLEEWPCIRNYGLGTKLPFDEEYVIEPLSDSTIYMAYYTIKHKIEDLDSEQLSSAFFDYVLNGKGSIEDVSEKTGVEEDVLQECRESYRYWYPLDYRTSAEDLVQNHLTFMIFHHQALLEEDASPRGIACWGMGLLEGKKMSSSKGHVVLPEKAMERYGADTIRFFLFASVEPWQEFDWREDEVEKYKNNLKNIYERIASNYGKGEQRENTYLDTYALSNLQKIIEETTQALENFQTRKAGLNTFFKLDKLVKTYLDRTETPNKNVLNTLLEAQIKMMSPFTPHLCQELWSEIGNDSFLENTEWPEAHAELRDETVERGVEIVEETEDDINEIADLVEDYETIRVIIGDSWKRNLFNDMKPLLQEGKEFGEMMGELVQTRKDKANQVKNILQNYMGKAHEIPSDLLSEDDEEEVFTQHQTYLKNKFDADIIIEKESESDSEKASKAMPGKPAIVLE